MVVPVADEATVHLVEGILVAALCSTDLGSLKVAGICPGLTPGRLPEQFVSLIILSLVFQCEGKVIDWLAVIRIRIALGDEFDSLSQIALSLGEAPFPDKPQAHGVQATNVVGVSTQGLLIVVGRYPRGVTVLFQVHTRKVELLVGLDLPGQQGCLGTVGDRTDVVGLGMPLEHGPPAIDEVF